MVPISLFSSNIPIHPAHLRKFRGAIIEHALSLKPLFDMQGISTDIFHNHDEGQWADNGGKVDKDELFRYPLVQYKVAHKKAALFGIGAGAKAVQLLCATLDEGLTVDKKFHPLVSGTIMNNHVWLPEIQESLQTYRLNKWLPFSPANYEKWCNTGPLTQKAELLDRVLWGHLHHCLEGVNATVDRDALKLYVRTIDMQSFKMCFGINKLALDITFSTNLILPDELGLGQGITIGFGKVQQIKNQYG